MKLKSIISCGLLLLGVGAATTSCEDMFTAENKLVTENLEPRDTLYQVMGILKGMQKLADRTVFLGEMRADLVEIDPLHAPADIQELGANAVSPTNIYNQPRDYYKVINDCNIYLAYVDTLRKSQGTRQYFDKEVCTVKGYRAWCYLELLKNYGRVPFITTPVLDSEVAEDIVNSGRKADMKEILDFVINDVSPYAYRNENDDLRQHYGVANNFDSYTFDNFSIPFRALLGELYLWRASYTGDQSDYINAVRMYHDYFTFPGEEKNTSDNVATWTDRDFKRLSTSSYEDYFLNPQNYAAGILPLDTAAYYGNTTNVIAAFCSQWSNQYYPAAVPSQRIKDISKSQVFCLAEYIGNATEVLYAPTDDSYYAEDKLSQGDLRLYASYTESSNFRESQYNHNLSPMCYYIEKYQWSRSDKKQSYIPFFRDNILYLHMAEALNRAGFPETAFAILKHGLTYFSLNDRSIISQDEFDRLCEIKSYGFSIQEPKYEGDMIAKTMGSFVIWPSNVFGYMDKSNASIASTAGSYAQEQKGGDKIQTGIHSLGSGYTEFNGKYVLDDKETLAGIDTLHTLPALYTMPTRNPSQADSLSYDISVFKRDSVQAINDSISAKNAAYLASSEVRAVRQAHVSKLVLEEEALEGAFEGLRFYDIMRFQMQELGGGAGIGSTITMPAHIEEQYGPTPRMSGKPWFLQLP